MKTMQFINKTTGWAFSMCVALLAPLSAHAVIVVPDQLEVVTIPNVSNIFQTVNLENTYISAIPVCIYNMPTVPPVSGSPIPAVVRITNIAASSFDVKIQRAATSGTETPGDVHCVISETGDFNVGGVHWEAGSITPNVTSARGNFGVKVADVVTPLVGGFTLPVVLHQVMSNNDANWSTGWAYSNTAGNPPTAANIHVGKHIANDTVNITRVDEEVGYMIIETGSGTLNGVANERALGADTLIGATSGPVNYLLSRNYRHGIASQNAMDGGDGGWAILLGATPLAGTNMALAIDEDTIGDSERAHTTEQAAYWAFEPVTVADLGVTITDSSATYAPGSTVVYTVVVSNTGVNDSTDATLTIAEPAGITFTSWLCAASGTGACVNASGVGAISQTSANLPVGETLTFTVNADVPSGFAGPLVNTATVSSATFTDNDTTNDTATDTDAQSSLIDLEVSNDDGSTTYTAGTTLVYTMSVTNNGPSDASNVNVVNAEPAGTTISGWICAGASCPAASGTGAINETAAGLASGVSLVYTVNVAVPVGFSSSLVSTASASATETDSDNTNNSATDTNLQLIDSDNDGILDSIEIGPDPANPLDADADGVPDYLENNSADTDGDGLSNNVDADDDGDGLLTIDELGPGGGLNPADSDGDGRPDYLSASKVKTGVDGGGGSMSLFIWLVVLIRLLINKIIKRQEKCSKGFYRRYC